MRTEKMQRLKNGRRIELLWVAYNCPVKCDLQAGSQTFQYYFRKFHEDGRFHMKLIACGKQSIQEKTEQELSDVQHTVRYLSGSKKDRLKNPVNWESSFNILFNRHANMIQNTEKNYILRCAGRLKSKGYEPDVIILEWTNIVVLANEFKKIFPRSRIAASEHDVAYIGFRRNTEYFRGLNKIRWKIRYARCKAAEIAALKICDIVITLNYDYRFELLEEGISERQILRFVPFFHNLADCRWKGNSRDILFFGDMSRGENERSVFWFIDNVMPLIAEQDVRFVIMGANPSERLISKANQRIIVTGFVDSLNQYFERCMCFVAPLVLGAGIKIKVLEAMSSGIPVLTNHIGIEGIPAADKKEYFQCEKPEDYVRIISNMIKNKIDTKRISENAKRFIQHHFSYQKSVKDYKERVVSVIYSEHI